MKAFRRIVLAFILVIAMLAPTFKFEVSATSYVANWGQRGVVATYLSDAAKNFYTKNNATYEVLSKNAGGSSTSLTPTDAPSSPLYKALQNVMKSAHTHETSYDETRGLYRYTDCVNGNTSGPTCFYTGKQLGDWDGGDTWNREHTWPNSKGDGNSENDIMMLRPTSSSVNSSRGNTAYGESSGYYDPNQHGQNVRGDAARTMLYVYTRWENSTNLSHLWGSGGVMENVEVLLDWIEEDPVDTWEMGRNDAVQSITGTRNIFVDYPEYAFQLFGRSVPTTMQTPSGIAKNGEAVDGKPCEHTNTKTVAEVKATCTEAGKASYVQCVDCNTVLSGGEKINPLGHNYVDGVCSRCKLEYGSLSNIVFEFGEKGEASHFDGTSKSAYTVTSNGCDLAFTNATQFYAGASDAKGNSCLKIGASSKVGSFEFTVPDGVTEVVFKIAGYKNNTAKISINGGSAQTISTHSDNGEYTEVKVDTSTNKKVTFTTQSGGYRCMIDSITFIGSGYAGGNEDIDPEIKELLNKDTLTIAEAIKVANSLKADIATAKQYYVTGVIDEVSNTTYGNIYITDGEGNRFYLYGLYILEGNVRYDSMSVKPVVGDTIKVQGAIVNYNGETPEMSPAYLVEHNQGSGNQGGDDPVVYDTITIAEAVAMGSDMAHDTITSTKYYISGVIVDIEDTYYGNMTIEDGEGNSIYIYISYEATGEKYFGYYENPPVVGDTIKVLAYVGNYNGAQLKNVWILEYYQEQSGGNQGGGDSSSSDSSSSGTTNPDDSSKPESSSKPGDSSEECNHVYGNWNVVKQPTATETGIRYKVCRICRHGVSEVIPALGEGANVESCSSSVDFGVTGLLALAIGGAFIVKKRKEK